MTVQHGEYMFVSRVIVKAEYSHVILEIVDNFKQMNHSKDDDEKQRSERLKNEVLSCL